MDQDSRWAVLGGGAVPNVDLATRYRDRQVLHRRGIYRSAKQPLTADESGHHPEVIVENHDVSPSTGAEVAPVV